jgi:hypothetical protein
MQLYNDPSVDPAGKFMINYIFLELVAVFSSLPNFLLTQREKTSSIGPISLL